MCFFITDPRVHKAEKDIKCFKVLKCIPTKKGCSTRQFTAYFVNSFKYKINKTYSKLDIKDLGTKYFKRGNELHYQGFHSYIKPDNVFLYLRKSLRTHPTLGGVAVECIIPKGSLYLKAAMYGEYISSSIKIVGILTQERAEKLSRDGKRKQKA